MAGEPTLSSALDSRVLLRVEERPQHLYQALQFAPSCVAATARQQRALAA